MSFAVQVFKCSRFGFVTHLEYDKENHENHAVIAGQIMNSQYKILLFTANHNEVIV